MNQSFVDEQSGYRFEPSPGARARKSGRWKKPKRGYISLAGSAGVQGRVSGGFRFFRPATWNLTVSSSIDELMKVTLGLRVR